MISKKKSLLITIMMVAVVGAGLTLSGCKKDEEDKDDDEQEGGEVTSWEVGEDDGEVEESDEDEDTTDSSADFSDFKTSNQTVGSSTGKESAEYTLKSIKDTSMTGYHRFEFVLESSESDLAEVEAKLVSSGGYVRVILDRVTSDQSGIGYQSSRTINEEGVLKIYHAVTSVQSEEVYDIGVSKDTSFYLHKGSGLSVILDVKYPGEVESEAVSDPEDFTDGDQTLSDTNSSGDVRINSYSWAIEGGVLKFSWSTSSASGNTTPPTTVGPGGGSGELVVKFDNLQNDGVLGSDNSFEASLSGPVSKVMGSKSGSGSEYVFLLTKDTEWRIYRSSSPNQVVLEVKL